MKSAIFWDITPCSLLKVNWSFGGRYPLHLQDRRISGSLTPQLVPRPIKRASRHPLPHTPCLIGLVHGNFTFLPLPYTFILQLTSYTFLATIIIITFLLYHYYLIANGVLPGGSGNTTRHNTKIQISRKITRHAQNTAHKSTQTVKDTLRTIKKVKLSP
jgi:hypothetical protein